MAKERCQKRSFQDSLENIKKQMKEKRNKNLADLGRRKSFICAPGQVTTSIPMLLANYQNNNRSLVLALENEKSKVKEAQDIILQLRRECYYLTCQLYTLKRKLSQQTKDTIQNPETCPPGMNSRMDSDTRESSMKNLLQIPLQETHLPGQVESFHTEGPSSAVPPDTLDRDFDDILPGTVSFRRHLKKPSSGLSQPDIIQDSESHLGAMQSFQLERRKCGNPTENTHELNNVQNVCHWNKDQITLSPRPIQPGKIPIAQEVILETKSGPMERGQKNVQGRTRERARANRGRNSKPKCKQKGRKHKKTVLPPLPDHSVGSSDVYNFNAEEGIHITPFRQKKTSDSAGETNPSQCDRSICESSSSEDDSDDLYLPSCKYLHKPHRPVTRPRSKRELKHTDGKVVEECQSTQTPMDISPEVHLAPRVVLKDIANSLSSLVKTGTISLQSNKESPLVTLPKRRCTTIVSYKEPTLSSKLRRGDPFTDLGLLNSPIFKKTKDWRRSKTKMKQTR